MTHPTASEQYRRAAETWVDLDGAARALEASRHDLLHQRMLTLGEKSVSRAEMIVRASPEWQDHTAKMVRARTAANRAKVAMEFSRMRFQEWVSADANGRAELRMGSWPPSEPAGSQVERG